MRHRTGKQSAFAQKGILKMATFYTRPEITFAGLRQPESPWDILTRFGQLQSLAGERRINELREKEGNLRLRALQRSAQGEDAVQRILAEAGGDIKAALPKIMQVAPDRGIAIHREMADWERLDTQGKINKLKLEGARIERLGQIAGGITDQNTYSAAINQALQEGLMDEPTAQRYAAQPYDANTVKQFQFQALTVRERMAAKQQELELEHNRRMELPSEEREFQAFYPTWLEANNLAKNAKNEMAARDAFRIQKRTPTPGVDVPLSPEVEAQKRRIAAAGRDNMGAVIEATAGDYLEEANADANKALAQLEKDLRDPKANPELRRNAARIRQRIRERVRPGTKRDRLSEMLGVGTP
jgi:hypothetical protein